MSFTPGVVAAALGAPAIAAAVTTPFNEADIQMTGTGALPAVKCLVYGSAGAGKTRFCATAPSPFIISAEAGLLSIRNYKIPYYEVTSIAGVESALEWCKTKAGAYGIKTICLDSISEIAEKCLDAEKAKTRDPRQAYGELSTRIVKLVKDFRDLPGFNVIVTAKQTSATDQVTGVVKFAPTAPGQQIGPALPYLFDLVMHAFTDKEPTTGKTYHALRTHAAYNAEAKDRSGALDELEYQDFANIMNKILQHKE